MALPGHSHLLLRMFILRIAVCICDKYQNFTRSGLSRRLCELKCFAIILKRKRKLVALLLLSYRCIITINVMWLFLAVPWAGLQYVIVVFPIIIILTYFSLSDLIVHSGWSVRSANQHSAEHCQTMSPVITLV